MSRRTARRAVACLASLLLTLAAVGSGPAALAEPTTEQTDQTAESASRWTPSSAGDPLLVIVDVSGSMAEEDASGRIKLDGAKAALSDLVQRRPPGSRTGLWQYPGAADSCHPGGYVGPPGITETVNPTTLAATIRTMEADGDTPTGPALRAAAAGLKDQGLTSATVLLVSDGESNCGEDACEAAEDLVAQGYDVTVEALGFEISDTGRNELECIAAATGGDYYNITDAEELETMISRLAVANLDVAVTAPPQAALGSAVPVEVRVENPSTRDVRNATVSLVFEDKDSRSVFPGVIPPRYRLGNIPAGETVSRRWTVSAGSGASGGSAHWVVTAAAGNSAAVSRRGSIAMVEADTTIDMAGPVLKDIDRRSGHVAIMGDSYSSGEGAGDYLDPGSTTALCHRSNNTHTVPVMKNTTFAIIACSGAVAANIDSFQDKEAHNRAISPVDSDFGFAFPQALQLSRLPEPQDAVVMTLGGNDIGFGEIIAACSRPWPLAAPCHQDRVLHQEIRTELRALPDRLTTSYEKIDVVLNSDEWVERRGGTRAPILVLAYPQVLPDTPRFGQCKAFNVAEVAFGNQVVRNLNDTVRRAVGQARLRGVNVHFVPNTESAVLPDHTSCDEDPYINPIVPAFDAGKPELNRQAMQELFHPNANGYLAMSNALVTWSATTDLAEVPPAGDHERPALRFIDRPSPDHSVPLGAAEGVTLRTGGTVSVSAEGFTPGTPVRIALHSDPVTLASVTADDDGRAHATVGVPFSTPPGQHTLHAQGTGADAARLDVQQAVTVKQAWPWWMTAALLVAVAAALGTVLVGAARWRSRR